MTKLVRLKMIILGVGMTLCLFHWSAWAEEKASKDYQEYDLGEIVVKGLAAGVKEIAIINEVTPEDFEITDAKSVADALTYVPGMQVTYGKKDFPFVSIHGFNQNRILTLIDGVPYYETKYGGLDLNQIALEGIARIDVVKGAPSVLYGANAEGGVINIITKKPTEKPSLSLNGEYGLDGYNNAYRASLSHGMKKGIYNYWLSYSRREWDSWDLSDDFVPYATNITSGKKVLATKIIEDGGERLNSDYKSDNLWAKIGVEPSEDTEAYANLHYIKTIKGSPPSLDRVNTFATFTQFFRPTAYDDWGIDLSGKHDFTDKYNLQGKLFYHNHQDELTSYTDETYQKEVALSTYKDYILGGMALAEYRPVDYDTVKFALHYKGDSHKQRDLEGLPFAESTAKTGSTGLENEYLAMKDKLSVIAGISYDWYKIDKAEDDPNTDGNIVPLDTPGTTDELNPMFGASYRVSDSTKVFGSVARKTRFPTLNQIFTQIPNLDLQSEKSINYTVGISWDNHDNMKIEISPFYHHVSDWITRSVPPSVNPFGQYLNFERVEMIGGELNAEWTPNENFLFRAGYVYNKASNKSPDRLTENVTFIPKHNVNLMAQYIFPKYRTKINGTMLYTGESYYQVPTPDNPANPEIINEDYTIYNAKITQPFKDRFEAYLSVNNLFDRNYEPNIYDPAPGRSIWLGLTYRL